MIGSPSPALAQVALHARLQFIHFVITQASRDQYHGRANDDQHQPGYSPAAVDEEQRRQTENRAGSIKGDRGASLRPAARKQHVMDVLAVALKDRPSAEKSADHGDACIDHRQTEGHQRNRDRNRGRSFLSSL